VDSEEHSHHPRPPAVLVYRAIEAPSPKPPRWPRFRPFRRPLALDQFLEVDPLPLGLREQGGSRLRTEVPNDDTSHKNGQFEAQM
jgi:hypothetical protein